MCGIFGLADYSGPVNSEHLIQRRDKLTHRGPDDAGIWISADRRVGLAHRRLAILDLSPAGHQPMLSQNGRYAIVFNGEVYNFSALRAELEKLGYHFKGGSDTEVVLAAYQEWGENCLGRFNGMFALAIHDRGNSETGPSLFFARDRAGKKPFYYLHDGKHFQFASELKAIDGASGIDTQALNYYLALGYVPGELCLTRGVKKLPPAHAARLDLNTAKLRVWKYWSLPENTATGRESGDDLANDVESLLMDSVKLRLASDVPLGVLLSGGLDSSLVVAAAARQVSRPVKTFTISLPGTSYDEAPFAKRVADYYATDHHVLEVSKPSIDFLDELGGFVDEPIADSSLIPAFMVSKLTRTHVTVALGGDGGDELFGGYTDYPTSLADQRRFGWLPEPIMKAAGRLASRMPAGVRGRNRLASLQGGPLQQMIWGSPYFDVALRRRIFTPSQLHELGAELDAPERWLLSLFQVGRDPVDSMTRTHFGSILPDDFLVKVDRTSMANGLEMRSPFLDHRLVEYAFARIPSNWKVQGRETRRVQRILAKRLLPPDLDTNRKQGFSIPLDDWLRHVPRVWHDTWLEHLPSTINKNEAEALIIGLSKGRTNGARIFALAMLGLSITNLGS